MKKTKDILSLDILCQVQGHPEIWDATCPQHYNQRARSTAWAKVAEQLKTKHEGVSVELIKKTYKGLLASRKLNLKRAQANSKSTPMPYLYAEEMAYIPLYPDEKENNGVLQKHSVVRGDPLSVIQSNGQDSVNFNIRVPSKGILSPIPEETSLDHEVTPEKPISKLSTSDLTSMKTATLLKSQVIAAKVEAVNPKRKRIVTDQDEELQKAVSMALGRDMDEDYCGLMCAAFAARMRKIPSAKAYALTASFMRMLNSAEAKLSVHQDIVHHNISGSNDIGTLELPKRCEVGLISQAKLSVHQDIVNHNISGSNDIGTLELPNRCEVGLISQAKLSVHQDIVHHNISGSNDVGTLELPKRCEDVVSSAMGAEDGEIVCQAFGLNVLGLDLRTLQEKKWLNDMVILFYLKMIQKRSTENIGLPSIYVFDSKFYEILSSKGFESVSRWTKDVDIFSFNFVFVVVCQNGNHWCLAVVEMQNKCIVYYNSLGGKNMICLENLRKYLETEHKTKKGTDQPFSTWTLDHREDIPRQMNSSDCGVFVLAYAEFISRGAPMSFSQEDMPYFRKKIAYEIVTKQFLNKPNLYGR